MDDDGTKPTRCDGCCYPIELEVAAGSNAICPECGSLNTNEGMIRRAKRSEARQRAAVVIVVYGIFHLFALILMFRHAVELSLPQPAGLMILVVAMLLGAVIAVRLIAGCVERAYADALIPAYFFVYLITLIFGIAECIVLVMSGRL